MNGDGRPPRQMAAAVTIDPVDFGALIAWIRTQLDDDELVARNGAAPCEWEAWEVEEGGSPRSSQVVQVGNGHIHPVAVVRTPAMGTHIARQSPRATLIDIAARRSILSHCEAVLSGTGEPGLAEVIVRLLASAFAGRSVDVVVAGDAVPVGVHSAKGG